jgi:hypothetical protein
MPSAQRAWLLDRQRVCRRKALGFPGARRIARELGKLYDAGVITGADDSNLVFYACLIRDCGATVLPAPASDPQGTLEMVDLTASHRLAFLCPKTLYTNGAATCSHPLWPYLLGAPGFIKTTLTYDKPRGWAQRRQSGISQGHYPAFDIRPQVCFGPQKTGKNQAGHNHGCHGSFRSECYVGLRTYYGNHGYFRYYA